MRIGVISDIHSNAPALEAVLADMGPVDALWCLGDFVGYGPWPNECIARLRQRGVVAIAGNHDLAAVGLISAEAFNPDAAIATEWTARQLTGDCRNYLGALPPLAEAEGVTLAHGSPRDPVWEYLLDDGGAKASFDRFSTQLCLVGHTHIPSLFVQETSGEVVVSYMPPGAAYRLGSQRAIANPGSVGQPRDRDPRAAYLIYDAERATLEWCRVAYDTVATQARMREVRLPQFFVDRLADGV